MHVTQHPKLPELLIIEPKHFGDTRGFFFESFQAERYAAQGISTTFVQDNCSRSTKGVLRGLHHQKNHTQGKLIYATRGQIFDVAVDIRQDSPTFGQWASVILNDQDHHQFYIPPGFAHGFCVLSEEADIFYKCTNYYNPSVELTLRWDDPDVGIEWPIQNPLISPKDQNGKFLKDIAKSDLPIWKKL
ncbi:MAG: dTDP-4-dehydrorhamnose 3,5-epimerase [Gammaproteobacteria bacterium GWE2_42_36]|nr:MAG: dTDP-4-dehydrorhamnose 3,5-epimerase [Gammaproteobacteria bacterium GWE2_42_36]HCU05892.1 dTDP-4-dehydrorhamnose 3,5-epimerase [Coxiellaceae bacterium]